MSMDVANLAALIGALAALIGAAAAVIEALASRRRRRRMRD